MDQSRILPGQRKSVVTRVGKQREVQNPAESALDPKKFVNGPMKYAMRERLDDRNHGHKEMVPVRIDELTKIELTTGAAWFALFAAPKGAYITGEPEPYLDSNCTFLPLFDSHPLLARIAKDVMGHEVRGWTPDESAPYGLRQTKPGNLYCVRCVSVRSKSETAKTRTKTEGFDPDLVAGLCTKCWKKEKQKPKWRAQMAAKREAAKQAKAAAEEAEEEEEEEEEKEEEEEEEEEISTSRPKRNRTRPEIPIELYPLAPTPAHRKLIFERRIISLTEKLEIYKSSINGRALVYVCPESGRPFLWCTEDFEPLSKHPSFRRDLTKIGAGMKKPDDSEHIEDDSIEDNTSTEVADDARSNDPIEEADVEASFRRPRATTSRVSTAVDDEESMSESSDDNAGPSFEDDYTGRYNEEELQAHGDALVDDAIMRESSPVAGVREDFADSSAPDALYGDGVGFLEYYGIADEDIEADIDMHGVDDEASMDSMIQTPAPIAPLQLDDAEHDVKTESLREIIEISEDEQPPPQRSAVFMDNHRHSRARARAAPEPSSDDFIVSDGDFSDNEDGGTAEPRTVDEELAELMDPHYAPVISPPRNRGRLMRRVRRKDTDNM